MTIGQRVTSGYVGILALVMAMLIVGVVELAPLQQGIKDNSDLVLAQADAASQMAMAAKAMGTNAAIGVVGSGSDRSEAISQLEVKRGAALAALDKAAVLEARVSSSSKSANLAKIEQLHALVDEFEAAILSTLALDVSNHEGARAQLGENVFPLGEQLDAAAAAYYEGEQTQALAEARRLASNADTMLIVLCVMAGILIAGGVLFSIRVPRAVSRHLQAAVSGIDGSTAQMLAIASQVAAGAAQTSAAANETTSTVEEVRQTAVLSQENAARLAEHSDHVARFAESSRMQAETTIAAFGRIESQMDVVSESIDRLSEQTQTVTEVMVTVEDIAEQSNLLSVNASIEAAKAGEQGRGFAVVAQEVKSLAAQSKQAVSQVRTILDEIHKAGKTAVRAAEEGRGTIDAGKIEVTQAEASALSLAEAASETAQSAMKIAASSQQQLAGMEQISQAIGSINQAGKQSVEGTRQVEDEVTKLQELALRLRSLVETKPGRIAGQPEEQHSRPHAAGRIQSSPALSLVQRVGNTRTEGVVDLGVSVCEKGIAVNDCDMRARNGRDSYPPAGNT